MKKTVTFCDKCGMDVVMEHPHYLRLRYQREPSESLKNRIGEIRPGLLFPDICSSCRDDFIEFLAKRSGALPGDCLEEWLYDDSGGRDG
jgi:hypothetical protein